MDMEKELGHIFSDALTWILSTVTGFSPGTLSQDKDTDFDDIMGVMNLNGKKNGLLFVSAKEPAMRLLCSRMTGVPDDEVPAGEAEDLLCELVNMTAGNAKLRLSNTDYAFALTQPIVIKGDKMSLIVKNRTHIISRTIGNKEIAVKLKVVY